MSLRDQSLSSFSDDSRGVSTVIGFIFIFAIVIILLSVYQAQFVPQENREVEFRHFQEVQSDMIEIRSAIATAGQADVSQYPTIRLGTTYPARTVAVNPSAPTGTLRTSDAYNISIVNETGADPTNVSTRFLEYRNGYNEMDIGSIWYEHSVLYLDERETGGRVAVYEDQNIIQDDASARLTALQNEIHETSTGRVTVELYPTESASINSSSWEGNITLNIPTRLNGTEYWDDELSRFDGYNGVEENAVADGIHYLNITADAESLKFNTVGIDSSPADTNTVSQGVGMASQPPDNQNPSPPDPSEPRFDTLTVEVSDGNINQVEASGAVTQADSNGQIQMELFQDSAGNTPFGENSRQMTQSFTIPTSPNQPNEKKLYVEIRLLDGNDAAYQTCFSDKPVRKKESLSLSEFTCQTP
ncbi:hypothetical protein [Halobellus sp. Atlit-38R]|uniref:hypothetical protein n=1 Tax=Halobellus sp. Atlit-38R TaxID=2282131 RepID=UPI0011C4023A|nr:hypothetical protein [Halobellus sp. Atlit-38R]